MATDGRAKCQQTAPREPAPLRLAVQAVQAVAWWLTPGGVLVPLWAVEPSGLLTPFDDPAPEPSGVLWTYSVATSWPGMSQAPEIRLPYPVLYAKLNADFRDRQRSRWARHVEGWDAYQAFRRGEQPAQQPDEAWDIGWQTALHGGPREISRTDDLCPGVMSAPLYVGPDPGHIAGDLEWACACCAWRIAPDPHPQARPAHVPVHPGPWPGVDVCLPVGGLGWADYFPGALSG